VSGFLTFLAALLALPTIGWILQLIGTGLDRWRYPPPGRLVQVGGHKLHLYQTGTDQAEEMPMVVLEAGIGASSLSWRYVQDEIEPLVRVASYDRAGLGWSTESTTPRHTRQVVHELLTLLDNAGIREPVVLVGHSFGGMTSLAAACLHPERFAGLVLVDPLHPAEWTLPDGQRKRMLEYGAFLAERGVVLARFGLVRATLRLLLLGASKSATWVNRATSGHGADNLERLVGEVRKLPRHLWPQIRAQWTQEKTFASLANHLRQLPLSSVQAANAMRPLDMPLVVISAGNLEQVRLDAHRGLAQLSPQGHHIIAHRAGHWVQVDEPDIVVAAIRRVLNLS
jgi:pimeloyl-ACP methyl ester carboxylesterase